MSYNNMNSGCRNSKAEQGTIARGGFMKKLLTCLFGMLLAASVLSAAPKYQTFNGEIMDSNCANVGSHGEMMKKEGAKDKADCSVKCVKTGAKYVLFDPDSKTVYQLDDQFNAYEYAGYKVAVTGVYNAADKSIRVHGIEVLAVD
jgi:hypothetical protein